MKLFPEKTFLFLSVLAISISCQGCVGHMFYQPDRAVYDTPDRHGLKYEQVTFQSKDGTRLSGWLIPAVVRDKIAAIPHLSVFRSSLSHLLIGNDLSPDAVIANIAPTPLLIIHGTRDSVVPYSHGKRLFELAREPKQFWTIQGGDHTEAFADPGSEYRQRLVNFFDAALEPKGQS